uniref:Transposase n=2 Tax=Candidatus Kentrum sp. MB TaxID=2138164 RepID=A0A450XVK7_9GAMM|nr:MAG: hypothetical protein BECKMB1821I_GA0114274_10442 [Candidatus Kentron sp. MB]
MILFALRFCLSNDYHSVALGIDIAKQSFELHGHDESGRVVKLSGNKLPAFVVNLPPCVIGMEACGGADLLISRSALRINQVFMTFY